jgi:hypothetical protein
LLNVGAEIVAVKSKVGVTAAARRLELGVAAVVESGMASFTCSSWAPLALAGEKFYMNVAIKEPASEKSWSGVDCPD